MNKFQVDSPVKIMTSKNKKGVEKFFDLNINKYRNLHWSMLAKSKKIYGDVLFQLLAKQDIHLLQLDEIEITYQMIASNKRKFDTMNIVSIIDKYFQDVMVGLGIIKDDNYNYVKKITILPVIIDKELPEHICRITVKEYQ